MIIAGLWVLAIVLLWRREQRGKPTGRRVVWLSGAALGFTCYVFYISFLFPIVGFEHSFPIDDSYITLTAARNVAERNLFAVNPEQPLAGITSPLHVLLVGLLGKLIGVEWAARLLGFAAFGAIIAGLWLWMRRLGASLPVVLLAAASCAMAGPLVFGALNGLETDLFAALLVWSFFFFEKSRERPVWLYAMGAAIGLAIVTRPEGYFLAATLYGVRGVEVLRQKRWREWRGLALSGLLALALIAPYLAANYRLLGQVLPITVSVKKDFFLSACMGWFARLAMTISAPIALLWTLRVLTPLLLPARDWWRRGYPPLFLLVFYLAYLVEFPGALTHYWGRYQHPLFPIIIAGMALGGGRLVDGLYRHSRTAGAILRAILVPALLLIIASGAQLTRQVYRHAIGHVVSGGYLMSVVDWLREHSAPGDLVAVHDIGVVSYFSERPVLDLVGLTDPEIAEVHRKTGRACFGLDDRGAALYRLLERRKPKIIVISTVWEERFLGFLKKDYKERLTFSYRFPYKLKGIDEKQEITINQYDFYLGDWN